MDEIRVDGVKVRLQETNPMMEINKKQEGDAIGVNQTRRSKNGNEEDDDEEDFDDITGTSHPAPPKDKKEGTSFLHVFVPICGSQHAIVAFWHAVNMAKAFDASLTIYHGIPDFSEVSSRDEQFYNKLQSAQSMMAMLEATAVRVGVHVKGVLDVGCKDIVTSIASYNDNIMAEYEKKLHTFRKASSSSSSTASSASSSSFASPASSSSSSSFSSPLRPPPVPRRVDLIVMGVKAERSLSIQGMLRGHTSLRLLRSTAVPVLTVRYCDVAVETARRISLAYGEHDGTNVSLLTWREMLRTESSSPSPPSSSAASSVPSPLLNNTSINNTTSSNSTTTAGEISHQNVQIQKPADQFIINGNNDMSTASFNMFDNVLMLYDGSHHAKKALQLLIQYPNLRRLTILHIIELGEYDVVIGGMGHEDVDKVVKAEEQLVILREAERIAKRQSVSDIGAVKTELIASHKLFGEVAAEYAVSHSLVVTGCRGDKTILATAFTYSKHSDLLAKCNVPILTFKISKGKLSFV